MLQHNWARDHKLAINREFLIFLAWTLGYKSKCAYALSIQLWTQILVSVSDTPNNTPTRQKYNYIPLSKIYGIHLALSQTAKFYYLSTVIAAPVAAIA